jgi:hypothetical protein
VPLPVGGTVTYRWGDWSADTRVPVTAGAASATHTYATIGTFTVDTTIREANGNLWGYTRAVALATPGGAPPVAPVLDAVTPASGPAGTGVALSGSGFLGSTAVRFGAADAHNSQLLNDSLITCDAPAGTGMVAVVVLHPNGNSNQRTFTYEAEVPEVGQPL